MGKFTRDLSTAPAIDKDSITVVSEESTNETFKVTLADLLDSSFKDASVFDTALGTITKSAGTAATLSDSTDHSNISVGDALVINGAVSNIVIAKGSDPNITVIDSEPISAASFDFGAYNIATRDNLGNVTNVISTGGISVDGTSLVTGDSEIGAGLVVGGTAILNGGVEATQYRSKPTVGYSEIKNTVGDVSIQKNVDDGMITQPLRPSVNAVLTSNQGISPATWVKLNFARVDGTDIQDTTFNRYPISTAAYDTTNHVFPVPYTSDYSEALYLIAVGVRVSPTADAGDRWNLMIKSGPTATESGSSTSLRLAEEYIYFPISTSSESYLGISRIVKLDPGSDSDHRYLSVWIWHDCTVLTIDAAPRHTYFSVCCLG